MNNTRFLTPINCIGASVIASVLFITFGDQILYYGLGTYVYDAAMFAIPAMFLYGVAGLISQWYVSSRMRRSRRVSGWASHPAMFQAALVVGLLLSWVCPIYVEQATGFYWRIGNLERRAWNTSLPDGVGVFFLHMLAGFLIWAVPLAVILVLFHPRYYRRTWRYVGKPFQPVTLPLARVYDRYERKFAQRSYDRAVEKENRQRTRDAAKLFQQQQNAKRDYLRSLFEGDFKGDFNTFTEFEAYMAWASEQANPTLEMYKEAQIRNLGPTAFEIRVALDLCKDAEKLLGLKPGYTAADLKTRYYNLMKLFHEDATRGKDISGNDIARRITEARDLLKSRKGWK
jgi:hypothetical protein